MGITVKVYIGVLCGKGLFYAYENRLENGITFYTCENLGKLIRDIVYTSKEVHIKCIPKICRMRTFIF